jgi:retinol dehydrogenase-14
MAWDIRGKTVLLTGATNGIGLEASAELARLGARVVMVGRDPARTEAAVAAVRERSGSPEVSHFLCDFSSQKAIRQLAESFQAKHDRLHVLLNNAGGVHRKRRLTEDGIEATFAVNHLGYFLLTELLLDLLVRSAPARVVTVASDAHRSGRLDFDDLGFERDYSLLRAYSRSKLANVLFSAELARRLEGTGVTANSVHPGAVNTNIWSGGPFWVRMLINVLLRPFLISVKKGAAPLVHLAASPELEGVSGRYFDKRKEAAPSGLAQDKALAGRLWDVSAALVARP